MKRDLIMKKTLSILLAILLLALTLTACDLGGAEQHTKHTHEYAEANCKLPRICSCGMHSGYPLNNHSFEKGVCTVCEKDIIDELGRMGLEFNNTDLAKEMEYGIGVETVEGSTSRDDIESIAFSASEKIDENTVVAAVVTVNGEGFKSGVYEWYIILNEYVESSNSMRNTYLFGTLEATSFNTSATLTEVVKEENYRIFEDDLKPVYTAKAVELIDRAITGELTAFLKDNESGITVADLGFKNYK